MLRPSVTSLARQRLRRAGWATLRAEVWERDGMRCVLCGWTVSLATAEVHHRKLRSRGGRDDHPNCLTLCPRCHHDKVHGFPVWATVVGLMVPAWADPSEWPVLLGFDRSGGKSKLWQVPAPDGGSWDWVLAAPHPDQHDEPGPWAA